MAMERDNKAPRTRKRRKVCAFCADKVEQIDYKDAAKLRRFISERAKILPRRTTGTCAMAPAPADRGHQARPSDRPVALCDRLIVPTIFMTDSARSGTGAGAVFYPGAGGRPRAYSKDHLPADLAQGVDPAHGHGVRQLPL